MSIYGGNSHHSYGHLFYNIGHVGSIQPMSAFGRMDNRLKEADRMFATTGHAITEELTAALRRIQIASRRFA